MSDTLKTSNFNEFKTIINPKLDNPNNIKFHWNLLYMQFLLRKNKSMEYI